MEQKTIIKAEDNKQEIIITREFDIPIQSLYKAHVQPELIEVWMGTNVLKFENRNQGAYLFETKDDKGNIILRSKGVIHSLTLNEEIVRTFEMSNTPYPPQLEFFTFEKLSEERSKLTMQVVYKSIYDRNEILKLPFKFGINRAHNKLETLLKTIKYVEKK